MKTALSDNKDLTQTSKKIGLNLCTIRKSKNLSQTVVAKAIGVTQSSLSQLERGQRSWSCPLVIKLIKYYKVSYESVFGDSNYQNHIENNTTHINELDEQKLSQALNLLVELSNAAKSDEITLSVRAYIYICIYNMLRRIYQSNPHNSNAIFNVTQTFADDFAKKIIVEEPHKIAMLIKSSSRINKNSIELPIEFGGELREVISKCEKFISDYTLDY